MGPMSGMQRRGQHSKCREGERCTGPGCKVQTGKTQAKREGTPRTAERDS